ncbi:hypothetical protein, conserved [Leishmania lindenbergi]|uniref:Uncharacterized protein n=1 Tax=Leishmania lindenbergi TaxID=651832 RepID=A0AAW3AJW3_9TRYP
MVRQSPPHMPPRVPSARAPSKFECVDAARNRIQCLGLKAVGAATGNHSAVQADPASRRRHLPAVPTIPKRAGGRSAVRQLKLGSSASTTNENLRGAHERRRHLPPGKARSNSVGDRIQNPGPSYHTQLSASTVVTLELPRTHSTPHTVTPMLADGLTGDDLLLLCGVNPGSSKAIWYTTMRAQLEARVLAMSVDQSHRGDDAIANVPRPEEASLSSLHFPAHRTDAASEPLVLPTEVLQLKEPPGVDAVPSEHSTAATRSVTPQAEKVPSVSSSEDNTEEVKEDDEDDGTSSIGTRATSFSSEKAANALEQGQANALLLTSLKKFRFSPKQLEQMHVNVLSLQALVGL